jgi:hypothetical protein
MFGQVWYIVKVMEALTKGCQSNSDTVLLDYHFHKAVCNIIITFAVCIGYASQTSVSSSLHVFHVMVEFLFKLIF